MISKFIPIALSLFSLSCNSFSLGLCKHLRDVPATEYVSTFTLSLHDKGCLDLGVDVVRTSERQHDGLEVTVGGMVDDGDVGGVGVFCLFDSINVDLGGLGVTNVLSSK